MDSNDDIADGNPASARIAEETGVYARLAALEMLLFPVVSSSGGLVGTVTATLGFIGGRSATPKQQVPPALLPMVLLVWGPGRILPVRVAALSITEKLYDATLLNPTHVEAQITLRVLTQDELKYRHRSVGRSRLRCLQLFASPAWRTGDHQSGERGFVDHWHAAGMNQVHQFSEARRAVCLLRRANRRNTICSTGIE